MYRVYVSFVCIGKSWMHIVLGFSECANANDSNEINELIEFFKRIVIRFRQTDANIYSIRDDTVLEMLERCLTSNFLYL